MNKLKSFEDLQIHGNPIQETASPETVRQLIIAKVANLKKCQRTEVQKYLNFKPYKKFSHDLLFKCIPSRRFHRSGRLIP